LVWYKLKLASSAHIEHSRTSKRRRRTGGVREGERDVRNKQISSASEGENEIDIG